MPVSDPDDSAKGSDTRGASMFLLRFAGETRSIFLDLIFALHIVEELVACQFFIPTKMEPTMLEMTKYTMTVGDAAGILGVCTERVRQLDPILLPIRRGRFRRYDPQVIAAFAAERAKGPAR